MPQTPISATAQYNSTTPATLYTVPAGRTAVVKSILSQSVIGGYNTITINKVSGGVTYPLVASAVTGYANQTATAYFVPANQTLNLLNGPITLGAGDAISVSTSTTPSYKFPAAATPTTNPGQRISNLAYLSSGHYVAVGNDTSTGYGLILTSTDGITWTKQTFNFYVTLYDIAYDGSSTYVVVGTGGSIYYSTNLTSWTENAITANTLYTVTYGNSKWVAGGASGQIAHATTASGSWTKVTPNLFSSTINSILTIGTNWAFGNEGQYFYSSNLTSFTFPYSTYFSNPDGAYSQAGFYGLGSSVMAIGTAYDPNTYPSSSILSSTDYGKTITQINLSALSNRPTQPVQCHAMNNGGFIGWMQYHPGNSRYLASSDGTTWTSQNFTGTQGTSSVYWWNTNLYGQCNTQGNAIISCLSNDNFQIGTVSSSGIYSLGINFAISTNYLNPNAYGYLATTGAGNSASWVAMSTNPSNTQYTSMWYGTSTSNGSDSQYSINVLYTPSFGQPYCMTHRPNRAGYLVGAGRYILWSTTATNGFGGSYFDAGSGNNIYGLAAGTSTSSTSRIIAVANNGNTFYSIDQGNSWATGGKIPSPSGFSLQNFYMGTGCVVTNGTYWVAIDSNYNFYTTTDGLTWVGNPVGVSGIYNLNSLNIFVMNEGMARTSGTSVDTFTFSATSQGFNTFPSVRRMAFANGTYAIGSSNSILTSTDLSTWTSRSISNTQINADTFISTSTGSSTAAIAYSGSGAPFPFVVAAAVRTPSADNCNLGKPTPLATALSVGFSTAGIVEIS